MSVLLSKDYLTTKSTKEREKGERWEEHREKIEIGLRRKNK